MRAAMNVTQEGAEYELGALASGARIRDRAGWRARQTF